MYKHSCVEFFKEEIDTYYYVAVVYHEIGHFVFKNVLSRGLRIQWAEVRDEEVFPIILDDMYGKQFLWEEEFCIFFSFYYLEKYMRRSNMKEKAEKIKKKLAHLPKRQSILNDLEKNVMHKTKDENKRSKECSEKVLKRAWRFFTG